MSFMIFFLAYLFLSLCHFCEQRIIKISHFVRGGGGGANFVGGAAPPPLERLVGRVPLRIPPVAPLILQVLLHVDFTIMCIENQLLLQMKSSF